MIAQCIQFLLAGHGTTATTLTMLVYSLALNPAVQERLINEIDDAMAENKGAIDYDKIDKMQYMDMVICETLRLYSPIIRIERTCSEDGYNLHGVILDKDTLVTVSPFSIHHDQQFYPDPEKFDPERKPKIKKSETLTRTYRLVWVPECVLRSSLH
uniref:Cytochrome P450 n=1 Tax=Strigamia maritima TaxID=126957 RepID=T1JM26_STRMM